VCTELSHGYSAGTRRTDPAALPRGGLCLGHPLNYRIPLDIQMCRPMVEMWVVKVPGSQADTYFPQSQKTAKILLPTHSPKQERRPAHSEEVLMDPQAWQYPRGEALRYPWCAGPLPGRITAPEKQLFSPTYCCDLSHSLGCCMHGAVILEALPEGKIMCGPCSMHLSSSVARPL